MFNCIIRFLSKSAVSAHIQIQTYASKGRQFGCVRCILVHINTLFHSLFFIFWKINNLNTK